MFRTHSSSSATCKRGNIIVFKYLGALDLAALTNIDPIKSSGPSTSLFYIALTKEFKEDSTVDPHRASLKVQIWCLGRSCSQRLIIEYIYVTTNTSDLLPKSLSRTAPKDFPLNTVDYLRVSGAVDF